MSKNNDTTPLAALTDGQSVSVTQRAASKDVLDRRVGRLRGAIRCLLSRSPKQPITAVNLEKQVAAESPATEFQHYRHCYLRVSTQGSNRLTISTFLSGLTFASLIALLVASPPTSTIHILNNLWWFANGILDLTLGVATLLFLVTAFGTFAALQHIANLSPTIVQTLADIGSEKDFNNFKFRYPLRFNLDIEEIDKAYSSYMGPALYTQTGLGLVFISLLIVNFRAGWLVGVATVVVGTAMLIILRPSIPAMLSFDSAPTVDTGNPAAIATETNSNVEG
jgi:hypothetical protein